MDVEARLTLTQDEDTNGRPGVDIQTLTIEALSADGTPEQRYLAISTERWAFDTPEELAGLCQKALDAAAMAEGKE